MHRQNTLPPKSRDVKTVADYQSFLQSKRWSFNSQGIRVPNEALHESLFPFQRDIVRWALGKGRCAVFADTGLGKTLMELEWANQIHKSTGERVLILAPLAVAKQTAKSAKHWGINAYYARNEEESKGFPIVVTNYERIELFDITGFIGVALDESSILKSFAGKTCKMLIDTMAHLPYRSAWTATPAPNDHQELGTHSEFLGVMTRTEMLASFFVHDGGDTSVWRLKGHAESQFWKWMATWATAVRTPLDMGYIDDRYNLPPLNYFHHCIDMQSTSDNLFGLEALTLSDQRKSKRESLALRVAKCNEIVLKCPLDQWLIWCETNEESKLLSRSIDGAVEITGSDLPEIKEDRMIAFSEGRIRVIVSKPSICGFGMNWQNCANMIFASPTHSFEQTYQAIRRCWRFGQDRFVNVHFVYGSLESAIIRNVQAKSLAHDDISNSMVSAIQSEIDLTDTSQDRQTIEYLPTVDMGIPSWVKEDVSCN